jgi:hypothetical protein
MDAATAHKDGITAAARTEVEKLGFKVSKE